MPTNQLMVECESCEKPTLHVQQKPNHLLHLFLSIITGGLWVLVWIFQSSSSATCTICGHQKKASTSLGVVLIIIALIFVLIGMIFG